jgi:hypothetical protein
VSGGTSLGANDIVLFKLDSNGNFLWSSQNPTVNTSLNDNLILGSNALSVDSQGNSYIVYRTTGRLLVAKNLIFLDTFIYHFYFFVPI